MDHGGGTHLQGDPEGTGSLQGVRGGDGGRIYGESHDDSAWAVGRGATELENPGHRGGATDISNGLPGQGRPLELTGGGMPGPSGNEDGDAGTLPPPERPRHRGHFGVGKPPPPKVHLMRHAGPLAGTERQAPCHSSVRQGSGAEEEVASGGGARVELREVLRVILGAAVECNAVLITGTGVDDGRR